jgi:hypothetical protein
VQKSVLFDLLKTLSPKEKNAFLRFLQSPYYGARPEVLRLADQLLRSGAERRPLHKTTVFPNVFGSDRSFDDGSMRKTMEQLLRLLEQFLITEMRDQEDFDYRLRLATVFIARKQEKLLRRLTAQPLPFPPAESDWTTEHFEQAARWYQLLYDHRSISRREHDPQLYERVVHCQTVALLASRLRSACIFRTNQKDKADLPTDPLLVWATSISQQYAELPLLKTLFSALKALQEPADPTHFDAFRAGMLGYPQCFSFADRSALMILAINYCSKRYNDGDKAWLSTQLDLYEHGLQEGLLLENGWLTGYTFTNIATLALIARQYERLGQLLHDYGDKIAPRDRSDVLAFNEARLYHALRQYQPALIRLQGTAFDDLLLNLSAKTVQAKCFYELGEHDLLEAHLEALRKFIKRHKEVGYYGERYLNFIGALRRVVKANPAEIQSLRGEIAVMTVLAEQEWLLEQTTS